MSHLNSIIIEGNIRYMNFFEERVEIDLEHNGVDLLVKSFSCTTRSALKNFISEADMIRVVGKVDVSPEEGMYIIAEFIEKKGEYNG